MVHEAAGVQGFCPNRDRFRWKHQRWLGECRSDGCAVGAVCRLATGSPGCSSGRQMLRRSSNWASPRLFCCCLLWHRSGAYVSGIFHSALRIHHPSGSALGGPHDPNQTADRPDSGRVRHRDPGRVGGDAMGGGHAGLSGTARSCLDRHRRLARLPPLAVVRVVVLVRGLCAACV